MKIDFIIILVQIVFSLKKKLNKIYIKTTSYSDPNTLKPESSVWRVKPQTRHKQQQSSRITLFFFFKSLSLSLSLNTRPNRDTCCCS